MKEMKASILLGGIALLGVLFVQPSFAGYREAVLADSPDAYWPFDEDGGIVGVDLGSGGNDMTHRLPGEFGKKRIFKGTVTAGVDGSQAPGGPMNGFAVRYVGEHTGDGSHNGSDSRFMLAEGSTAVTFEFSIKTTQVNAAQIVGGQAGTQFNTGVAINKGSEDEGVTGGVGSVAMSIDNANDPSFGNVFSGPDGTINDGEWHHVVTRWERVDEDAPAGMDIFIDGVKEPVLGSRGNSGSNAQPTSALYDGPTYVGVNQRSGTGAPQYYPGGQFEGDLDEISIYSTALSDAQIINHYNNWATGIPEPATLVLLAGGGLMLLRRRRAA